MKKLMSKLVAFALVATLAFALTGCFVTPTTTISFNKLPEATYEVGSSEQTALTSIVVTLSDTDYEESGNLWDLKEAGKIVVEGFDLSSEGAKTAKIIFGTAVLTFKYTVTGAAVLVNNTAELKAAVAAADGVTVVKVVESFSLTEAVTIPANAKVVLDLNEKTLTAAIVEGGLERLFMISAGASLEVKGNGTINNENECLRGFFDVSGDLIIQDGTYTDMGNAYYKNGSKVAYGGCMISINAGANATIYGGEFNVVKPNLENANDTWGRQVILNRGSLKIYGGIINHATKSSDYGAYAIISEGELFIYNATIDANRGPFTAVAGTFDVRGGKFIAHTQWALYIAGETADVSGIVSGGEFINDGSNKVICIGNGTPGDGGACAHADVIITGGSFKGLTGSKVQVDGSVGVANFQGGSYYKPTFTATAQTAIGAAYELTAQNAEGWASIVKKA